MSKYQYKVVQVEAHQLSEFNTEHTVQIPSWVIAAFTDGTVKSGTPDTSWVVKKPDGSFGCYSDENFQIQFEKV